MPALETAMSRIEMQAAGTRSVPVGPAWTSPFRSPGLEVVPRIGTGRVWGPAAGIAPRLIHSFRCSRFASATTSGDSWRHRKSGSAPLRMRTSRSAWRRRRRGSSGQLAPAEAGSGAAQEGDVALGSAPPPEGQRGPVGGPGPAVADLERRAAGPVIKQDVAVEAADERAVLGHPSSGVRGGRAGVDPA